MCRYIRCLHMAPDPYKPGFATCHVPSLYSMSGLIPRGLPRLRIIEPTTDNLAACCGVIHFGCLFFRSNLIIGLLFIQSAIFVSLYLPVEYNLKARRTVAA